MTVQEELKKLYEEYCHIYNCRGCDLRCKKIIEKYEKETDNE